MARSIELAIVRYANRFPQAQARALNRAGTTTRAVMAREISGNVGLPINQVRNQMRVEKATPERLVVRIAISGRRLPLGQFKPRGPRPSKGRGAGVTVRLPGGVDRHPDAFIIRVRGLSGVEGGATGSHTGVFKRVPQSTSRSRGAWSKNLPIYQLYGPSLPKVFQAVSPIGLAAGEESLRKNLVHELKFAGAALAD